MNELYKVLALNGRRFFQRALRYEDTFEATYAHSDYSGQTASDIIKEGLLSEFPFVVSRFGYGELRTLLTYLHKKEKSSNTEKFLSFIKGEKVEPWWSENTIQKITHNAGVFPDDITTIEDFSRLILNDLSHIDVLGSWLGGERWVKPFMTNTKFIRFLDFYHFLHKNPWTKALEGKNVLVIHPFTKSIENQYQFREFIFTGVHSLPKFNLITYKAFQSIAGNKPVGFNTWFQVLDRMKQDIANINFDIAILACGAYGMPLAVHIKRDLKRKAIHLGGNAQILFGIKGSRWEGDKKFAHIFNSYWVKPLPDETPKGHETIDNNCYW